MNSKSQSLDRLAWKAFCQNEVAVGSTLIVGVLLFMCIFAHFISPHNYYEQDLSHSYLLPSRDHWLGTDALGRDLFSRILYGGRISFLAGFTASIVSIVIGVTYGSISGFVGHWVDRVMMRTVDIVYALPYLILVILLMVFVGRGLLPLLLAIGAVEWLTMARLVRGQVRGLKDRHFVQSAEAIGQTKTNIILRHILPNTLSTIIVCASITIPYVMLQESLLSFLGLGIQAPMTSWGTLIKDGVSGMEEYPHVLLFPALFFFLTLLCLNFVGDALRDVLDPRRSLTGDH